VPDRSPNGPAPDESSDGEDLLALLAPSESAPRPRPGPRGRRPAQQGSPGSGAIGPDDATPPVGADSVAPTGTENYPIGQPDAAPFVAPIPAAVPPMSYTPPPPSAPPPTPPVIHSAEPVESTAPPVDRFSPVSDAEVASPVAPAPAVWVLPEAEPVAEPVGEPARGSRTMPAPAQRTWSLPPSVQAAPTRAAAVSPDVAEAADERADSLVWTPPAGPVGPSFGPSSGQPYGQPDGPVGTTMAGFGVGRWFQPLPGTPPVAAADGVPGPGARMVVAGGTPVHAVAAGTISPGQGGAVKLHTDEGLHISYAGLAADSVTAPAGNRVAAGAILGAVAGAHGRSTRGELLLDVRDPTGEPVDAVRLLLGLPDPNELGFAAVGGGLGVDPDDLDRMLGEARTTTH
jgi:hypothetical protein